MEDILKTAKEVLKIQQKGIEEMASMFDCELKKAVNLIAKCEGHIIVSGVGKSGNIATKISATMSSIGIPSFFIDPSNAGHGDMGGLNLKSVLIVISNSGEALEIMEMLNFCKERDILTVSITRNVRSSIANNSNISLVLPQSREAHEFNAPTTSTTQTLVLGDILAVCASKIKNFTKEEYAKLHPSGNLGMKISKVKTVMQKSLEVVERNGLLNEVLQKMTKHSNGFVCVVENEKLFGIITDGDIRRFLLKGGGVKTAKAEDLCNQNPKTVQDESYIIDAVNLITKHNIQCVVVLNKKKPTGFISSRQFKI